MNWTLVSSVALVLNAPYTLGMAASGSSGNVLSTVSSVAVDILETDSEQTVTLTDDGSDSPTLNIFLDLQESLSAIGFDRDYLNLPTDVGVSFSTTNATSYPAGDAYTKLYPPENVVPLGPLLSFELPYSAIKFNDDAAQKVVIVMPLLSPQYRGFFDPADPLGVEVRIKRADGSESFSLEGYVAGGGITIYKGALDRAYGGTPPDIISISVQPVDYSGVLQERRQNRQDKQSLGAAQAENDEPEYRPGLYYANYQTGLFKLEEDYSSSFSTCSSGEAVLGTT